METNDYYIEIPNIAWDRAALLEIMHSYPLSNWQSEGYANKYLRPKLDKVFEDLYNQFPNFELNIGRTFFAELAPKNFLKPHIDQYRTASINFPLIGDWGKSPVRFHSEPVMQKKYVICEHVYNELHPTVINTTVYHSAQNPTDDVRYLFSLSVYEDWDSIKNALLPVSSVVEHTLDKR